MRRAPRRFVRVMALTTASCAAAAWFTGCCTSKPSDPASRRGAPIPGPSTGDLPDAQLVSKISVPVRILEGKIWSLIPVPQDVQRELRPTDNSLVLRLDSPWRYKCQVGDVYGDGEDYRHSPPETSSASVAGGSQPRPRHGAPLMAAVRQIRSPRCAHRLKPAPASAAGGRVMAMRRFCSLSP